MLILPRHSSDMSAVRAHDDCATTNRNECTAEKKGWDIGARKGEYTNAARAQEIQAKGVAGNGQLFSNGLSSYIAINTLSRFESDSDCLAWFHKGLGMYFSFIAVRVSI